MPFVSRLTIVQWSRPRRGLYRGTVFLAQDTPETERTRPRVEVTIERGYEPAARRDVWRVTVQAVDRDTLDRTPYRGHVPLQEEYLDLWKARRDVDKWQCAESGNEYPGDPVEGILA